MLGTAHVIGFLASPFPMCIGIVLGIEQIEQLLCCICSYLEDIFVHDKFSGR